MASTDKKIAALERASTSMQAELGQLQQLIIDREREVKDDRQLQTAAMNVVVDQARDEFQGQATAISQQSGEINLVVEESTKEFQNIKKGCEEF